MGRISCGIAAMLLAMLFAVLLAGCGMGREPDGQEGETEGTEQPEALKFFFQTDGEDAAPDVAVEYAETADDRELAAFLAAYYQIPSEQQAQTRYYYNYVDIDSDGTEEIFAVVIGQYTERDGGDPALLLSKEAGGGFSVLDAFDEIRTPVLVSGEATDGWHDIIYQVYGGKLDGYLICHHDPEGGYQTDGNELVDEMPPVSGTQILSNNLIDDMDQGRYLTLALPDETEEEGGSLFRRDAP